MPPERAGISRDGSLILKMTPVLKATKSMKSVLTFLVIITAAGLLRSDETKPDVTAKTNATAKPDAQAASSKSDKDEPAADLPPGEDQSRWKKLAPNLWADVKHKWVIIDAEVVLREGPPLEMFACLKHTKEHESILAVNTKALMVHAALMAIGAKPGTPVEFAPKYKAATGPEIEIRLLWTDAKGKRHKDRAQDWIRNSITRKAMTHPFVFAGSSMWRDPATGKQHYTAEGGDLICVSNFPSATIDLPVESSQSNEGLLFEAFTDHIPPIGTKVRMVLIPKLKAKKVGAK